MNNFLLKLEKLSTFVLIVVVVLLLLIITIMIKKLLLAVFHDHVAQNKKFTGVTKMAAELEEMAPPFSLHSMDDTGSSGKNTIELGTEEEEEKGQDHKGVFVLREKSGVIHPVDYKYRVGEF